MTVRVVAPPTRPTYRHGVVRAMPSLPGRGDLGSFPASAFGVVTVDGTADVEDTQPAVLLVGRATACAFHDSPAPGVEPPQLGQGECAPKQSACQPAALPEWRET